MAKILFDFLSNEGKRMALEWKRLNIHTVKGSPSLVYYV